MLSGPKVISKTPGSISKLVVFLHGYGSSGDDLIGLSESWEHLLPPTIFLSPNGPEKCDVHVFGYQWYGIPDFSPTSMRLGLDRVRPLLTQYLKSLLIEYKLSPHDLALVGFSQGAIVALEMLFALPNLNCIVGYSGAFFPPAEKNVLSPSTNVLLIHGNMDIVVPYPALFQAEQDLKNLGIKVTTLTCQGIGHTIDSTGIQIGGDFLKQNLSISAQPIAL
jgi:phospholipase/carboxylesterase